MIRSHIPGFILSTERGMRPKGNPGVFMDISRSPRKASIFHLDKFQNGTFSPEESLATLEWPHQPAILRVYEQSSGPILHTRKHE